MPASQEPCGQPTGDLWPPRGFPVSSQRAPRQLAAAAPFSVKQSLAAPDALWHQFHHRWTPEAACASNARRHAPRWRALSLSGLGNTLYPQRAAHASILCTLYTALRPSHGARSTAAGRQAVPTGASPRILPSHISDGICTALSARSCSDRARAARHASLLLAQVRAACAVQGSPLRAEAGGQLVNVACWHLRAAGGFCVARRRRVRRRRKVAADRSPVPPGSCTDP